MPTAAATGQVAPSESATTGQTKRRAYRTSLTPAQRANRSRLGAYRQKALYPAAVLTARARSTFLARFEREVDPDGLLTPEERQRRALFARKHYFLKMAWDREKARKARAQNIFTSSRTRQAKKNGFRKNEASAAPATPATTDEEALMRAFPRTRNSGQES